MNRWEYNLDISWGVIYGCLEIDWKILNHLDDKCGLCLFFKLYLGARESASKLYIFILLKTWYVCNFRFVWPYYFKFEQYKFMGQNFEKKKFEFFDPPGGPQGGSEWKFSTWLIFIPKFVSDDSKQLLKKKFKKMFFSLFWVPPEPPLEWIFQKNFFADV